LILCCTFDTYSPGVVTVLRADTIRGMARDEPTDDERLYLQIASPRKERQVASGAHKVVVTSEHGNVVVGVDASDRPGLLLDISKGLLRLNLTLRHSEAAVVAKRSISIWRCEMMGDDLPDLAQIWSVISTLLESTSGDSGESLKRKGTPVIRAVVTSTSTLAGQTNNNVNFRNRYGAALVAVQKGGQNVPLSGLVFAPGDVLILQAHTDSPLLKKPPADFYNPNRSTDEDGNARGGAVSSLVKKAPKKLSGANLDVAQSLSVVDGAQRGESSDSNKLQVPGDISLAHGDEEDPNSSNIGDGKRASQGLLSEDVWKDLHVLFPDPDKRTNGGVASREFLAAMQVAPKSNLSGRTAAELGLDKVPGVFLVSIDRPNGKFASDGLASGPPEGDAASLGTVDLGFTAVTPDTPLQDGDVLWLAGGAQAVGDLRKIPGLVSFEIEEVKKVNEKFHDRRLVEAVIARRGPLVGKTVKQVQFRTRYGAAVIAVHRDGDRIHEHPGRIRLQAGDVLLLEAGPNFMKGSADTDRAFSLLAEVEDSAPPRLRLLIPAIVITVAMLAV
jgi:uncharacterized protein with PhoU and TrkA domain